VAHAATTEEIKFKGDQKMPFAKITKGPANAGGVDTDKQALILDSQNGIVEVVDDLGTQHALQSGLSILLSQTALTTVTTAQNLASLSLNNSVLNKLKRCILVSGYAIFSTAGTPQITIAVVIGGVTVVSIQTPAIGVAQTNGQIQFQFLITVASTGGAGTVEAHGSISVQGGASLGAAVPTYCDQNTAVSSAIALNTALTMNLTITSNVTLTSAQLRQGTVEVVN
jgi:hypothetical protein